MKRANARIVRVLAVLLLALPLPAFPAEEDDADRDVRTDVRAQMQRGKLERLKGWKRMVFLCSPPEKAKAKAKEMFERICERTNTNVKFLAATSNAQVRVAPDAGSLGFLSAYQGMLRLEVELFYSGCDASTCAVNAAVTASFPYDKAVDQAARSYPIDDLDRRGAKDSPAAVPRPIQALMWGPRQLTAFGYAGEELAAVIANAMDTILKEFFTDYVQANRE